MKNININGLLKKASNRGKVSSASARKRAEYLRSLSFKDRKIAMNNDRACADMGAK